MTDNKMNESQEISATVLFVDDETNILSSLKRLFRPSGYRILTAESGAQGLEIMAQENIDLVVSDMRMPEMNGAQFLEKVREGWPDTVRILLTGYAEISATIDAINKGQIYRYISKPWDDNEIILIIKHALQQKFLEREKLRLEELVRKQNEELKELNVHLEEKVLVRTNELKQAVQSTERANEKLKKNFITSVCVFSNLIEMRNPGKSGRSRRIAELARTLAQKMGMETAEVQETFIAGLLLDVGQISLPDHLLDKPFHSLPVDERVEVIKCPVKGEMVLMAVEQLQGAAKLIRSHREYFDGTGYPDRLRGSSIPLGARILALVKDYDTALMGRTFLSNPMKPAEALRMIRGDKGMRYDPAVVDAFLGEIGKTRSAIDSVTDGATKLVELKLRPSQAKPGMKLSRDLLARHGEMLLSAEYILNQQVIDKLIGFEHVDGHPITLHVYAEAK